MTFWKKPLVIVGLIGSTLLGGAIGAAVFGPGAATAQSTSTPAASSAPQSPSGGTWKSNEDPAHEAAESPEREAAEDAGQMPGGPASSQSSSQ